VLVLQGDQISRFMHGNSVACAAPESRVRVHGKLANGDIHILGLGEIRSTGQLHPMRVFAPGVPVKPELPMIS